MWVAINVKCMTGHVTCLHWNFNISSNTKENNLLQEMQQVQIVECVCVAASRLYMLLLNALCERSLCFSKVGLRLAKDALKMFCLESTLTRQVQSGFWHIRCQGVWLSIISIDNLLTKERPMLTQEMQTGLSFGSTMNKDQM